LENPPPRDKKKLKIIRGIKRISGEKGPISSDMCLRKVEKLSCWEKEKKIKLKNPDRKVCASDEFGN